MIGLPEVILPALQQARHHVHNFSGGPGALPESVLLEAQEAIRQAPGTSLSVLGMSHRSEWFRAVVDEATHNLRQLLGLSGGWEVLFLQGGASLQFTMVPLALLRGREHSADYVTTGYWSAKAAPEARLEGPVRVIWDGREEGCNRLPDDAELDFDAHAAYLHYVSNETVDGLQFHRVLGLDSVPRVCDMSSDFLSRPIEASRFAIIYAHAQKNLGPAGVTVAIVRQDVLAGMPDGLPAMLDYRRHAEMGSNYNTPPVFAIYVTLLVTRWLLRQPDGLAGLAARNQLKARALYEALDGSDGFYRTPAATVDRSWMNVPFNLPSEALDEAFVREAEGAGLHGLRGHRSRGGIRASLYNAVTMEAVAALVDFIADFRARNGGRQR